MNVDEIKRNLEALYIDYYDGLYSERQLKFLLKRAYKKYNVPIDQWSELILEAQWKHATETDYGLKRAQLAKESMFLD
ncbi:hypothetical protein [Paenibacillus ehimensis]|uniref:hypothetical protein n=1 Tax=Paenibacillus ehimensis TaxID=79264 RepID=UPI000FD79BF8|nr:hypothetical protein [Paenibacillus ehimensis]